MDFLFIQAWINIKNLHYEYKICKTKYLVYSYKVNYENWEKIYMKNNKNCFKWCLGVPKNLL